MNAVNRFVFVSKTYEQTQKKKWKTNKNFSPASRLLRLTPAIMGRTSEQLVAHTCCLLDDVALFPLKPNIHALPRPAATLLTITQDTTNLSGAPFPNWINTVYLCICSVRLPHSRQKANTMRVTECFQMHDFTKYSVTASVWALSSVIDTLKFPSHLIA